MKLDKCLPLLFLSACVFGACRGEERTLPRWLRVFSKGPHPEDEPYEGRELFNHVDNVLRGGTIGVEVDMKKHVGKLNKWWEKVKRHMRRFRKRPEYREVESFPADAAGIDPRRKLSSGRMRAASEWTLHRQDPITQ